MTDEYVVGPDGKTYTREGIRVATREEMEAECGFDPDDPANRDKMMASVSSLSDAREKKVKKEIEKKNREDELLRREMMVYDCRLKRDNKGRLLNYIGNCVGILGWQGEEYFRSMDLWYNELTGWFMSGRERLTDSMCLDAWVYMTQNYLPFIGKQVMYDAIEQVAGSRKRNLIKEYLEGVEGMEGFDKDDMLDEWLIRFAGAEDTEYNRMVGRKFIIGMVGRGMQPGFKMDLMIVLEGKQRAGKSRFCEALAGDEEFFINEVPGMGKDDIMKMTGKWVVELDEMSRYSRKRSAEELKSFISTRVDEYRRPYERNVRVWPRSFVLIGTTNDGEWLSDSTGNRRYWPIRVGNELDVEGLRVNRDLLFAQALRAYRMGELPILKEDMDTEFGVVSEELKQERIFSTGFEGVLDKVLGDKNGVLAVTLEGVRVLMLQGYKDEDGEIESEVRARLAFLDRRLIKDIKDSMYKVGWKFEYGLFIKKNGRSKRGKPYFIRKDIDARTIDAVENVFKAKMKDDVDCLVVRDKDLG